jgi:hypothetical protein
MLRFAVALSRGELESVTFTTKEKVPDAVGVPLIWPELLSVNPPGKVPELTVQLYGLLPPFAASVAVYPLPTSPPARDVVVILSVVGTAATTMLRFAVALSRGELESVTFTTKEKVPDAVGVPLIWPELLSVNPPGKAPELTVQLYGLLPPLAASVAVYPLPTPPPARDVVVI